MSLKQQKKSRHKSTRYAKVGLYGALLLVVILVFQAFPLRIDLTGSKYYSLSQASKNAVKNLEEPLQITAFLSSNIPSPYNSISRDLEGILQEYSLKGNRNFNYRIYKTESGGDETTEQGDSTISLAQSYGIGPIEVQTLGETQATATSVYMGLVVEYLNQTETIPNLGTLQGANLENEITSRIDRISRKNSVFLSLQEKVKVQLIYTPSLSAYLPEVANSPEQLQLLVNQLNRDNFNIFEIETYNTEVDTGLNLSEMGLTPLSDAESNQKFYYDLLVSFGDKQESVNLLQQGLFGGYQPVPIDSLSPYLVGIAEKMAGVNTSIGYLSTHGTRSLAPQQQNPFQPQQDTSISNFAALLGESYNIENVNLEAGIPKELQTLLVVSPKTGFSGWELYQLDQFVMRGGSLAVFYDTYEEKIEPPANQYQAPTPPRYAPLRTGLERVLENYGLKLDYSYVLDEKAWIYQGQGQDGNFESFPVYYFLNLSGKQISRDLPILRNVRQLFLAKISPVELVGDTEAIELFHSSDRAWKVAENINLYDPRSTFAPSEESRQTFSLGYLYEGALTSYFADKTLPERPIQEEDSEVDGEQSAEPTLSITTDLTRASDEPFIQTSENGRVLLIPTSAILTNDFISQSQQTPNSIVALNLIDYMSGRGDFAEMRAKGQLFSPIEGISEKMAGILKQFNIVGIPLLVVLLGLVVWMQWRKRQEKIRLRFEQE